MDNNLINIDDLVRQRLGGGEESERSGAWMRMQGLLEKEERRKPFGMLFWRRAIVYTGVAVLLASLTVGSYQYASAVKGNGLDANGLTASIQGTETNPGTESGSEISSAGVKANSENGSSSASSHNAKDQAIKGAIHTGHSNQAVNAATSATGGNAHRTSTGNSADGTAMAENTPLPQTKNSHHHTSTTTSMGGNVNLQKATASNDSKLTSTTSNNSNLTSVSVQDNTKANSSTNAHPRKTTAGTGSTALTAINTVKANNTHQQKAISTTNSQASTVNQGTTANNSKGAGVEVAKMPLGSSTGKTSGPKSETSDQEVAGSNTVNSTSTARHHKRATGSGSHAVHETGIKNVNTSATLANTAIATKASTGHPAHKHAAHPAQSGAQSATEVNNSSVAAGSAKHVTKPSIVKTETPTKPSGKVGDKATAQQSTETSFAATTSTPKSATKQPTVTKKVSDVVVLRENSTGVPPGRVQRQLDTISKGQMTQEITTPGEEDNDGGAASTASNTYSSGTPYGGGTAADPKSANNISGKTASNGSKKHNTSKTTGAGNTAGTTAQPGTASNAVIAASTPAKSESASVAALTPASAPPPSALLPNAAPPVAAPPAAAPPADAKPPIAAKKKKGMSVVESLSAMFNDIKFKVSGAQFAPGLTAGINGTFFGPNSFKGFQFGFSGGFEFDDKWSALAELKYFNRMNNNYEMHDDYFRTPTDSIDRSFSFSTLHSFELPVAIRYALGPYSFFIGGNFVYSVGINTGARELENILKNPTTTNTKEAPSISESDFNSRFGIGYLLGMSYKVSPNVTLDLRATRNVWDNAKSSGSKTVSDQLYKSPSLQVSIGYRLGGKKGKE